MTEDRKLLVLQGLVEKQCEFVVLSAFGMDRALKSSNLTELFFYAQALLSAYANISKLLWCSDNRGRGREKLRVRLGVGDSDFREREVRNALDHMDERFEAWAKSDQSHILIDFVLGPATAIRIDDVIPGKGFFRRYDPYTGTFYFWDNEVHTPSLTKRTNELLMRIRQLEKGQIGSSVLDSV